MKKVAILTLGGYFNYGNRLQNYALQEVVKSLNFDIETIKNNTYDVSVLKSREKRMFERFRNKSLRLICKVLKNRIINFVYKKRIEKRTSVFKQFTLDYICETDFMILDDNIIKSLGNQYDYFITGSDQVWNPDYLFGSSANFLTFAPKNKRISYAASFGVSLIPESHIEKYRQWISDMHKLSVREDDGAKIIKELSGRDAPVLIDPTLLITKEKWLSIARAAYNKPNRDYMLTYFIGGMPLKYKEKINIIVKERNLEVINLGNILEKKTYETGPSEFIDYINSSSIFCTDSFHGVVFSILLGKPFIVFKRVESAASMYSRIDTLLDKFNLNSRKIENMEINESVFRIDYSHIPPILEEERAKAFEYLQDALK